MFFTGYEDAPATSFSDVEFLESDDSVASDFGGRKIKKSVG